MKTILRFWALLLLSGIISSCGNDDYLIIDYFSSLHLIVEDENGNDITQSITIRNTPDPNTSTCSVQYNRDQSDEEFRTHSLSEFEFDVKHIIVGLMAFKDCTAVIYLNLFDEDSETVTFHGEYIDWNGRDEFEWEYKNKKLPMAKHGTNVTLVRHDDGTYSIKE